MKLANEEIVAFFSQVPMLSELDAGVVQQICDSIRVREFGKGELLVRHGKTGRNIFFVFSGKIEVRVPDVHGEVRKRVLLKEGDIVGEISLLIRSTYSADIVALTDVVALTLDSPQFLHLVETSAQFAEIMSTLMTERMAQNGGINRVGRYQLLGKLGEGSMATVFRAFDPELDREVALKMLKYKLACNQKFLDYFEQEARTIASMNHPNIVSVYEVIDAFSTRFIVMEKLRGENLQEILKRDGAFSIRATRHILNQVVNALEYAHSRGEHGIMHRDIKPANIVIDHQGHIKLTDFGIASPPRDDDFDLVGTPSYVAPEIVEGDSFDGRADIYSLGVTAYQLLTNSLPFTASRLKDLLKQHRESEAPDIRFMCLEIDDALATFVEWSLSKDPSQRLYDWKRIRKLLSYEASSRELNPDELGVLIRIRSSSYQETAQYVKSIRRLLDSAEVDYSIEIHRDDD